VKGVVVGAGALKRATGAIAGAVVLDPIETTIGTSDESVKVNVLDPVGGTRVSVVIAGLAVTTAVTVVT
jgi:hypothetical protein